MDVNVFKNRIWHAEKKTHTHKWKQSIPEDSKFIYILNEYMNDKQIVQNIT